MTNIITIRFFYCNNFVDLFFLASGYVKPSLKPKFSSFLFFIARSFPWFIFMGNFSRLCGGQNVGNYMGVDQVFA